MDNFKEYFSEKVLRDLARDIIYGPYNIYGPYKRKKKEKKVDTTYEYKHIPRNASNRWGLR